MSHVDAHSRRRLANWVNLSTPAGLAVAKLGGARLRPGPRGLWLADHFRWRFPRAGAFTVGDVLLTRHDWDDLDRRRPDLLRHEEEHAWQYVASLGLPFLPLYGAGALWSLLRTGDHASRNPFERGAGLEPGGYEEQPVQPFGSILMSSLGSRLSHGVKRIRP